ncbi:MAG: hypothetical protein HY788_01480 [Deltaproteobacteria bacterium]|nr:hypothetical protein [Deltaproteobacteria bacterium]
MTKRTIILLMLLFLPACVSDQQQTRSQSPSYPDAPAEEAVLTYAVTSDYGKEVTWSAKYSVYAAEGPSKLYRFPRGEGPPVRLEFADNKARINVLDLNPILELLGLPAVRESVMETPDQERTSHARYVFDWAIPREGRLTVEVVLCVCMESSITECPKGTTKRMGSKYYYCVGKIEHVKGS